MHEGLKKVSATGIKLEAGAPSSGPFHPPPASRATPHALGVRGDSCWGDNFVGDRKGAACCMLFPAANSTISAHSCKTVGIPIIIIGATVPPLYIARHKKVLPLSIPMRGK